MRCGPRFPCVFKDSAAQASALALPTHPVTSGPLPIWPSSQLGEFESGVTATRVGIVPTVLLRDVGPLLVSQSHSGSDPGLHVGQRG
jgi:hypothetical protein